MAISGWNSRLAGASLTLLAVLLLAPGSAGAASCGRHVEADPVIRAQLDRLLGAGRPAVPDPSPPPCNGPGCSEGRPVPPGPAPAGPVRGPQDWATLPTMPVPAAPPALPFAAVEAGVQPVRVADLPERPPRRLA